MAAFLDNCRFNPTAGGTTDWVYSAAVAGSQAPAAAGAANGRLYKVLSISADKSQWEISEGAYASASGTFARTTVLYNSSGTGTASGQSGAGTKISFTAAPQIAIIGVKEDLISIEEANSFSATQRAQARSNISAVLKGQIFGLTLSTAGPSATFTIAAGEAADSTGADLMALGSVYTKTTSAWAVGTSNGALDTGSIAASTWYAVHLIKRPDTGIVDILVSLSATVPTLPTNYTFFRRIGWMKTNGSSQWVVFRQIDDDFYWATPFNDVSAGAVGASRTLITLSAPPNTIAKIRSLGFNASSVSSFVIQPTAETDQAPGNAGYSIASEVTNGGTGAPTELPVDSSSQIAVRADRASCSIYLWTWSFKDRRGNLS